MGGRVPISDGSMVVVLVVVVVVVLVVVVVEVMVGAGSSRAPSQAPKNRTTATSRIPIVATSPVRMGQRLREASDGVPAPATVKSRPCGVLVG